MKNYSWLASAVTNPGEYTGRQVVRRFRLLDIEIFDLLNNGLQAYTLGTYKRVVNEDSLEKRREYSLEYFDKLERLKAGAAAAGRVFPNRGPWPPEITEDQIKQAAKCSYEKQLEDIPIVPPGCFAFSYTLPDDDIKRQAAISVALGFKFKTKDVEEYEQTHGIKTIKISLPSSPQEQPEKPIGITTVPTDKQPELETLEVDDYIKGRRKEGVDDDIIAYELHNPKGTYRLTYLEVTRALGKNENSNESQVPALKKRGERACKQGEKKLQELDRSRKRRKKK